MVLQDAPVAANLMEFCVGPTATQTFYVDKNSLSIDVDGVARYTLVSKSRSGAVNVSYEDLRYVSIERKHTPMWTPTANGPWRAIPNGGRSPIWSRTGSMPRCSRITSET